MKKSKSNNYEAKDIIAIYTNEKGETELMADVVKDTLWATESQISEIFLTTQQNVNLHLRAHPPSSPCHVKPYFWLQNFASFSP